MGENKMTRGQEGFKNEIEKKKRGRKYIFLKGRRKEGGRGPVRTEISVE